MELIKLNINDKIELNKRINKIGYGMKSKLSRKNLILNHKVYNFVINTELKKIK